MNSYDYFAGINVATGILLAIVVFIITFLMITKTEKNFLLSRFLYVVAGVGVILFTAGMVRTLDVTLRSVVFKLDVYGVESCEDSAENEIKWLFNEKESKKVTEEEKNAEKNKIITRCKKNKDQARRRWALARFGESSSLVITGLFLLLASFLFLRKTKS